MPDAIEMLQVDHRKVESLFERCKSSPDPRVAEQICNELTIHALVEEQVIYPLLDQLPGGAKRQEAEQEHRQVKEAIAQIEGAGYDPGQVGPLLQQLMDDVNHHVEEEESEVLPKMREARRGAAHRSRRAGGPGQAGEHDDDHRPRRADQGRALRAGSDHRHRRSLADEQGRAHQDTAGQLGR